MFLPCEAKLIGPLESVPFLEALKPSRVEAFIRMPTDAAPRWDKAPYCIHVRGVGPLTQGPTHQTTHSSRMGHLENLPQLERYCV